VRGCLFTLLLGAIVLGFGVYVGLPAAASAVLTAGITAAGLQADDTTVTVSSKPPTDLLGLHADRVRVQATHATFRGLGIGSLDVVLGDVAIVDRAAGTVDGELADVTVPDVGGRPLVLAAITLSGGGERVSASTTIGSAEAEALLADAVEAQLGVRPTAVTLSAPDKVVARVGIAVHARLGVSTAGDLEAEILDGPEAGRVLTLLGAGADLPIHLTSVRVTAAGDLRLTGDLAIGLPGFPGG
jgi:hypothetical protein